MIVAPPPPAAALAVSPTRIELVGAGSAAVVLTNTGRVATIVDAARAGFAIDPGGRPRVVLRGDPGVRLVVRPAGVRLGAGASAAATIVASVRPRASPGDHAALVVFTTRPRSSGGVGVRLRVGVVVVVRVPGAIVHRLRLARVRVLRRIVRIVVRNRGNVVELLGRSSLRVQLRGRPVRLLGPVARELLPGGIAVLRFARPTRHGRLAIELVGPDGTRVRRFLRV
jgi:hypothetical protein